MQSLPVGDFVSCWLEAQHRVCFILCLTQPEKLAQIDWSSVQVYWGDERCVPPDDPESNYLMARQALLDHVPLPAENVHRICGELEPEHAAQMYEAELRQVSPGAKIPRFDLVLLGLGEDGHTASLFPGSSALSETKRWVVSVEHTVPPPPLVTRISLTLPVFNAAANLIFLVSGSGKAGIFSRLMQKIRSTEWISSPTYPSEKRSPGLGGR